MLKLRLKKLGKKKKPFYRIAVQKSETHRNGKSISDVGFYDPIQKKSKINITKIYASFNTGVQPTATLANLFKNVELVV